MILTSLTIQAFRSYPKLAISFSPTATLFIGPNGVGKTNLLEAVTALALGKSFRAGRESDVISWGAEIGRVKGVVGDTALELVVTPGLVANQKAPLKKYTVNGVSRRMVDFVGNLRVVLFRPEDVALVTESPSRRRNYLDSVLIQVDREYRRTLVSYERALRQRNKLLERINEGMASPSQLIFWNQLLIKAGGYLTDKRAAFIEFVNNDKLRIANYELLYDKSVISESRLEQYKEEEIAAKVTLVGPHRDDFIMKKGLSDGTFVHLGSFGSRGEQRLGVLWLKLAELAFMKEAINDQPVLLLDDIFSELDEPHRLLVLGIIGKQQTILTSAEEEIIDLVKKSGAAVTVIHLPLV